MKSRFRILGLACLSIAFGLCTTTVSAQSHDRRLYLSNGIFMPQANLEMPGELGAIDPSELVGGKYYRVLQFSQLPSRLEKEQLKEMGVELLSYLPSNAFWASIDGSVSPEQLRGKGIRAILRLSPDQKMKQSLREVPLPAWATNQPGTVDLELNYPADISQVFVSEMCLQEGFVLLEEGYPGVVRVRVPVHRLEDLAGRPWVSFLEPVQPPSEPENYTGRTLHRSNVIAADHASGRHYDGTGVIVAMGDDGIVGPHIDFEGRIDQSRVSVDNGTHGDHVAGTIFGAGNLNPKNKGMAFGATLHVYQVWAAVNDGANANANFGTLFTSTSYSDGCNGGYTSFARSADLSTYQTPTLLHVFSAGNEGTTDCGYGAGAGWGNVTGGVKIGKNVLAVASINANGALDSYSSRGPAEDGRLKPEVAAKGGNVTSTYPNNTYFTQSGTSMACPGASGTLAQLAHAYRSLIGGQDPPSALLKAVLMNGCDDKGNPGPDFKYGFGEMNALRSVVTLENQTYFSDSLDNLESDTFSVTVPSGVALMKVMLYWHDAPGTVGAAIPLVNNLDLRVLDPTNQPYQPWILNHLPPATNLNANATRGRDSINNVEQVTISAPTAGTYSFVVEGYQIPSGPQGYHLVYEFRDSSVTITYPIGGESCSPSETEKIRWDSEISPSAWQVEYSADSGTTWNNINANVAGTQRYLDWAIPSTLQSGRMMVRVTGGGMSDASDNLFSVIRVPANLSVTAACPNYCTLQWDSIPTASGYDIFMLGTKYMDSVGTTTNRSFSVQGTDPNQGYWFAVRAKAADGATGRRTLAIYKNPGIWNCSEPNDVGVVGIPGPGEGVIQSCALTSFPSITLKIQNNSPNSVSNIPVACRIDGGIMILDTFPGPLPGNTILDFTFFSPSTMSLVAVGSHLVEAWTDFGPDLYNGNDTASINIETKSGAIKSVPYAEDFEAFNLCSTSQICESAQCVLTNDWIQGGNLVTDRTEWRTDRGGTPTSGTGPAVDHNPGTSLGNYLYVEANNCTAQQADLYTPCLDLSGMTNPYFSYWINLYGADMGDLHLDLFAGGRWNNDIKSVSSGNWGTNWFVQQVDLTAYAGQIVNLRFRGLTGDDILSDMAIDDVKLTEGPPVGATLAITPGLKVYPNPGSGVFHVEVINPDGAELRLRVRDLTGKIVLASVHQVLGSDHFVSELDLGAQPSGIYFLEVETEGRSYNEKVTLIR